MRTQLASKATRGMPVASRIYARATFMSRQRGRVGVWVQARQLQEQWPISNDNATMHSRAAAMARLRMTLSTLTTPDGSQHWLQFRLLLLLLPLPATNAKHFIKSSVHINQTRLPTAAAAASEEAASTLSDTSIWHRSTTSWSKNAINVRWLTQWHRLSNRWPWSPMGQNKWVSL